MIQSSPVMDVGALNLDSNLEVVSMNFDVIERKLDGH